MSHRGGGGVMYYLNGPILYSQCSHATTCSCEKETELWHNENFKDGIEIVTTSFFHVEGWGFTYQHWSGLNLKNFKQLHNSFKSNLFKNIKRYLQNNSTSQVQTKIKLIIKTPKKEIYCHRLFSTLCFNLMNGIFFSDLWL